MDVEYERKYHDFERKNFWVKARRQIILHYLKGQKKEPILDVGCCAGATMEALRARGFSKIYGIDISKSAIQACRRLKLNASLQSAEKTNFADDFFGAVIASDVLEHTSSDIRTMGEWHRILKPGGRLLLFVPAFMHLWSASDDINHHRKRYRLPELAKLAKRHGFIVKETSYWNFTLYMPHFFATKVKNLLNVQTPSLHAVNPFFNSLLYGLFSLENACIALGIKFPFGVSCFALLEKL